MQYDFDRFHIRNNKDNSFDNKSDDRIEIFQTTWVDLQRICTKEVTAKAPVQEQSRINSRYYQIAFV